MKKKLLLLLCLMLTAGNTVWAEIASGKFKGGNGRWSIDDEGTLFVNINSISSDFEMPDWGEGKAPWYKYHDEIKAIHIGSNLRNVGRNAFYGLKYVEKVTGGENVEAVAMYAFEHCGGGTEKNRIDPIPVISFPKCSYVGKEAFHKTCAISLSLPLVETFKEDAVWGDYYEKSHESKNKYRFIEFIDLGSKVKKLMGGSLAGPDYVFIQNPTPPDWERIHEKDASESFWGLKDKYKYPFGGNRNVKVIVPPEYLQTYIDYYPSKHPEVENGYMSAAYESYYGGWTFDKNEDVFPAGKLVAGGPIYEDGKPVGGWYVEDSELKVFFIGKTMPSYGAGDAPWNSVLGKVTKMTIECIENYSKDGSEFMIPENAFDATNTTTPPLKGIKHLNIKRIDKLNIDSYAFNCTDLETVSFEDCGRYHTINDKNYMPCIMSNYTFFGCKNLKSFRSNQLVIIINIGMSCFEGCESLLGLSDHQVDILIPQIFDRAFYGCKNFKWPDTFSNLHSIGYQAFCGADLSGKVTISRPRHIGEEAFADTNIEELQVGEWNNTYIESRAFANCTQLKDIYVFGGINDCNISDDLFDGIDIESITLHAKSEIYTQGYLNDPVWGEMQIDKGRAFPFKGDGWEINSAGTLKVSKFQEELPQPWYEYKQFVTAIEVQSNLTQIKNHAFDGMDNVVKVTVPISVWRIGDCAFKDCINLKDISISNIRELGNNVFENCSSLESIDLGMGLKKAGDYVFMNCVNLQLIGNKDETPAEVTNLTFAEINSAVYHLRGGKPKRATGQAAVTLRVPDDFVTNYIVDPNWGKFHIKFADGRGTWEQAGRFGNGTWILYDDSTMVVAAEKVESVEYVNFPTEVYQKTKRIEISGSIPSLGGCFQYFENLESVSLCPSIKALDQTFYNCPKLININLDNVETIGEATFVACGLTDIDLSKVKSVGRDAFSNCPQLTYATLGSQCVVGNTVFSNCTALTAVDLGDASLDDANGCFGGCTGLKAIKYNGKNLPKGIFSNCTALEEVRLGSRVRSIQWSAFKGCTALNTIYCDSPMPPSLPVEKNQDVIGYESGVVPIYGPEYDVWAFYDLDRPSIKLYVHPDCVPVYGRFDVWKEMDIQGNAEDVEPLLPTGGSLRGCGKDENGDHVISGSTWYLDEEGKLMLDALGNIAARTSDNNFWWSVFDSYLPFIATVEVTDDVTGVPNNMFGWIDSDRLTRGVTTVILGEGLKKAGYDTFHFSGIKDVYLYAENLVDFHGATFNRDAAVTNNATLHVLKDPEDKYLNYYKALPATKYFPNIVADLDPRHPKVQAVNFDFSEITLRPGEELQLDPHFTPADVEDKTLRYVDVSNGHHVYIDSDNGIIFAQSEGVAYIEAFSSYTVSGEEVMALWGPTQEIYLKVTITEPEPGQEIFFDYREGEGTEAPTITCHVLRDEQLDVNTWVKTCEIAGYYNEDDITTQAIPEWRTGTVNIPEEAMGYEVTRIGAFAFYERNISALYIPWTVTQIGYNACSRSDYLTDVYIASYQPLRLTDAYGEEDENLWNNDAFYRIGEGDDGEGYATLHVLPGSRDAWNIYPWNEWFRYIVEDTPIPDGIKTIQSSESIIQNSWFDLSGRKLGSQPTKPGLYIMNGKKIVIK